VKRVKLKGWVIGSIIGSILSLIFYFVDLGTSYCVKGLNFMNFLCSVNTTLQEFGFVAMILAIPRLFIKNLFELEGMGELFIFPLMLLILSLIVILITYLIKKK